MPVLGAGGGIDQIDSSRIVGLERLLVDLLNNQETEILFQDRYLCWLRSTDSIPHNTLTTFDFTTGPSVIRDPADMFDGTSTIKIPHTGRYFVWAWISAASSDDFTEVRLRVNANGGLFLNSTPVGSSAPDTQPVALTAARDSVLLNRGDLVTLDVFHQQSAGNSVNFDADLFVGWI